MTHKATGKLAGIAGTRQAESATVHIPVLYKEALEALQIKSDGRYIDATLGGGGHSAGILAASSPDGLLLGLDRDPSAVARARTRLATYGNRAILVVGSFERLNELAHSRGFEEVQGVLFDLGFSSLQISDPARGFAFQVDGPLDMRFNPESDIPTAEELVNTLSSEELVDILFRYGEEKRARRIVAAILAARPIHTTGELAAVVEGVIGRRGRTHPATRVFQALRIAVNDELAAIERALPQAVDLLTDGGRLAVISFHSLEDRLVKRFLRRESQDCICAPEIPVCVCDHRATLKLVSRKPISPSEEELVGNPRARSARLRVAERVAA
jgi:16S rRNA (cytosine1402-N4)-methyltransferase